jgi:hypothetical protein
MALKRSSTRDVTNGHYILRRGQAKFASNNRNEGTPEENKAIVQGSIAHFGTYTVNEAEW